MGFACGPAQVTTYPIADPGSAQCTTPFVWSAAVDLTGPDPNLLAESGSVTITSTGPMLRGTLSAGFGDHGSITGMFDAVICP